MKRTYKKGNITVVEVGNRKEGVDIGFLLLERVVDNRSILFLSGGETPKPLYEKIACDDKYKIMPKAVATVDERWGPPGHEGSNEEMIRNTGLYKHFRKAEGTEIHTILHGILQRQETAQRYNTVIEGLFERLGNSTAVMGIGEDGHTAGLAPKVKVWQETDKYVVDYIYKGQGWEYPERITLTPKALKRIKNYIILVFGESKGRILNKVLDIKAGSKKYPASLYTGLKANIYLITDQKLD